MAAVSEFYNIIFTTKGAKNAENSVKKIGDAARKVKTALIAMGAGAFAGLAYAVKEANAAAESEAKLANVLRATKNAAGLTKDELLKMASAFQKTTTFSDEMINEASSMLLTFTGIKKDAFEPAMQAALDMSVAFNQDLKSSIIQIGKALNDPARGFTALRRIGVSFTQEQEELIKKFQETGNVAAAQKVILDELKREFGGAAQAMTQTFGGQLIVLKNQLGDFAEQLGGVMIPILSDLVKNYLLPFAQWLQTLDKDTLKWIAGLSAAAVALGAFAAAISPVISLISTVRAGITLLSSLSLAGTPLMVSLAAFTAAVWAAYEAIQAVKAAWEAFRARKEQEIAEQRASTQKQWLEAVKSGQITMEQAKAGMAQNLSPAEYMAANAKNNQPIQKIININNPVVDSNNRLNELKKTLEANDNERGIDFLGI